MSFENYSKRNNSTQKKIRVYHKNSNPKSVEDVKSFKIDTDKYEDNTIRLKKRVYL